MSPNSPKKKIATLTVERPRDFDGRRWHYETEHFEVEVLAIARGYAMVRRRGCVPFVISEKQLST